MDANINLKAVTPQWTSTGIEETHRTEDLRSQHQNTTTLLHFFKPGQFGQSWLRLKPQALDITAHAYFKPRLDCVFDHEVAGCSHVELRQPVLAIHML